MADDITAGNVTADTSTAGSGPRTIRVPSPRTRSRRITAQLGSAWARSTSPANLPHAMAAVAPVLTALALGLAVPGSAGGATLAGAEAATGSTPPAGLPAPRPSSSSPLRIPLPVAGSLPGRISEGLTGSPTGLPPVGAFAQLGPVRAAVLPAVQAAAGAAAEPAAATGPLTRSGIPARVASAYVAGAARADAISPGCHLDWSLLAGIGRVESDHARTGGSRLTAGGRATPAIYGPRLTGGSGMSAVHDTDHGALDGDTVWDRAVGPMQFLPGTWRAYAIDGDGNGVTDPQDIDDAAATAGHYLCSGRGDLSTAGGRLTAVYRYNHSSSYATLVLSLAAAYAADVPLPVTVTVPPAAVPKPAVTPKPNPSPSTSVTPSPTPSPSTSAGPTPSESPTSISPSPSLTATPSTSPSQTPTATATPTPTATGATVVP
jgi:hypothetical protein